MYSAEEIKNILWTTFNTLAQAIELTSENGGCYLYNVFPEDDIKTGELSQIAQELFDSDLFEVTMHNDHLTIEYLNPYVLERKQFSFIYENIVNSITFEDTMVKRIVTLFNQVNIKYHRGTFFPGLIETLKTKKKLSKKQWEELKYLIDNGQTKYEAGVLSTKN